jgi:DNA-binding transcriptional LysR family regulator
MAGGLGNLDDDISLRHLRILALLLEVGSPTQVAQILRTTQPTISKALARLRGHFGDPLLIRVGHAMRPTPRGTALLEPLKNLLSACSAIQFPEPEFHPAASTRQFSLLVTEIGMTETVPALMREFESVAPGLRLRALPLDSRAFESRLEAGEADIAIGAFPRATGAIRHQRLSIDRYVSLVRRAHPRLDAVTRPEQFRLERHVIVTASTTGHAAHRTIERALTTELEPDRVHLRVASFVTSAFVASRTDMVATVPARLAHHVAADLKLAIFATPVPLPRIEINQFWHERVHRDTGHRWFRAAIQKLFARTHAGEPRRSPRGNVSESPDIS